MLSKFVEQSFKKAFHNHKQGEISIIFKIYTDKLIWSFKVNCCFFNIKLILNLLEKYMSDLNGSFVAVREKITLTDALNV